MSRRDGAALRRRANRTLRRLTGLQVNRVGPGGEYPADFDDEAKTIIDAVRPYTMTNPDKLFALISAVRYVVRERIPGDIVECGVWRGGSMQAVARVLRSERDTDRDLYLFDTFAGMTTPTAADTRISDDATAADLLATHDRQDGVLAMATLSDVRGGLAPIGYPADRLHFVEGKVEDTVPGAAPEHIAVLRLDTDWYESTKHELEYLFPRISSGGVLIIDDYGWWDGCRKAVDEYLHDTAQRLLLLRVDSGRVAVVP